MSDSDVIGQKGTEANYDRWHGRLIDARTVTAEAPRRAVLISEILGDEDGPHGEED